MSIERVLAPRYMSRFRCIASACEDQCCSGWDIFIDAEHFHRARAVMSTREGRASFETNVRRIAKNPSKDKFALVVLKEPGNACGFLRDDRMCDLQGNYGESMLPDACATFPRRPALAFDRVEMTGSLSCPEMARKALLASDAMTLEEADATLPRKMWLAVASQNDPDAYARALDEVRDTLLRILDGSASLSARLATIVVLADALDPWFARGKPFDSARLSSTLAGFRAPAIASRLERELEDIAIPLEIPVRAVLRVLAGRIRFPVGSFAPLIAHAAEAYGANGDAGAAEVAACFERVRARDEPRVGARLEAILENYAKNHVMATWFACPANVGVWARGLLLRIALIRFLFFAHPRVRALSADVSPCDAAHVAEEVAVLIISRMSKAVEHFAGFLVLLDKDLPESMPGLEHALCLLRL